MHGAEAGAGGTRPRRFVEREMPHAEFGHQRAALRTGIHLAGIFFIARTARVVADIVPGREYPRRSWGKGDDRAARTGRADR